ncbi:MAG: sel1 repeat family protein [Gammaproteobacteria bacterium]|jgi:hypothetical protein|nr:sel1 repeat family protein [Gammaproteobacteria bacterium]
MIRIALTLSLLLVSAPASAITFSTGIRTASYFYLTEGASLRHQAELGDPEAQYILAWRYYQPGVKHGIPHNLKKAAQWYDRAARNDHTRAQYNLGVLYLKGLGVNPSPVSAYAWLDLAARKGHPSATSAAGQLRASLNSEQLAAARALEAELVH